MNLHTGDKVRFLNEKGGGVIKKIISSSMAVVEIEDGFQYEYPLNQLVPDSPIEKTGESPDVEGLKFQVQHENETRALNLEQGTLNYPEGIYLAFIPENQHFPSAGKIAVALCNNTTYDIFFTLSLRHGRGWVCMESGAMRPHTEFEMEKYTPQQIGDWGQLKTDILFFSGDQYEHHDPVSDVLKLSGVKFFRDSTFTENELTENRAWISEVEVMEEENKMENVVVTQKDIDRMLKEKEQRISAGKISIPHQKNQFSEKEIDLHIEELIDNYSGMNNAQLIDIQLKKVQQELDEAIAQKLQRIIFIHGVGNGRLKSEVRKLLSHHKGIRFHDASFQRYGFGATEVELF
ncbi:MAG: DUF2027 domain-containing protein [Bacteroidetes bacterium]|nr:DUF2027 domain-containing protein [Bacteroidota bacterium]